MLGKKCFYKVVLSACVYLLSLTMAHAFPEMVRHGYINCTACHVSPAGGGLLSPYGRSMSKEILSRWSYEGEENFGHGAIKSEDLNSWLNGSREVGFNVGGDIRYIQTYRNSESLEQGKFFPMQRDMEMAFRFYNVTVVANYGIQYKPGEDTFDSRRSYVMYQGGEETLLAGLSLRAGRFLPIYGVMIADHATNIKRGLGFDQGKERDSAEINYVRDRFQATMTFAKSPKSLADAQEEKAFSTQLNYAFADKYKVGVSYWNGALSANKRRIFGLHGIWGFSHEFYAISEVDYQINTTFGTELDRKGIFYFQRFGYEVTRGVHLIGQLEGAQSDLDSDTTKTNGYGLGFNLYPRPHIELQGLWSKTSVKALDDKPMDVAYFIVHYYF